MWMSVEVVRGVRIVQCHAIIDVVIDVRVMLCHQAIDNSGFSTFLNFPLRVPILILLLSCVNHFVHTFAPRKHVIRGVVFTPRRLQ